MTMSAEKKAVTSDDIMSLDTYGPQRKTLRRNAMALKKSRRVSVGPFAEFHFECYQTMLEQIQEMLYIEKGGDPQLKDELAVYNPLIPQGQELVATLMLEIVDEDERRKLLSELGGIEHRTSIQIGGQTIRGIPDDDMERTDDTGKASSVHFIHFPFSAEAVALFKDAETPVVLGIDHQNYHHMAGLPALQRKALMQDFD